MSVVVLIQDNCKKQERFNKNVFLTKAPFIWRKVLPGKRVTLLAESTSASVYMRKKLTPLPEPTVLAHALIVSP